MTACGVAFVSFHCLKTALALELTVRRAIPALGSTCSCVGSTDKHTSFLNEGFLEFRLRPLLCRGLAARQFFPEPTSFGF